MNQTFLFGLYLSLMFAVAGAIAYQFSETLMWALFAAAGCSLVANVLAALTEAAGNRARERALNKHE